MSSEKKNKGRDPASYDSDALTTRLVLRFNEMDEVSYVRNIVIPVLEAENYQRVDFHHGPTEIGKDLIFIEKRPFNREGLVVAVVKVGKLSKSASDSNGFPVLVVQIDQARKNSVSTWDGKSKKPDKVLVILADDPSADVLSSHLEGYRDLISSGVEFICGSDIAESLLQNRPEIAEQILETKLDAAAFLAANPTNLPILRALQSPEAVDIADIFTDLDASVGRATIRSALAMNAVGDLQLSIEEDGWDRVSNTIRLTEAAIGNFIQGDLASIAAEYQTQVNRSLQKRSVEYRNSITRFASEFPSWLTSTLTDIDARVAALGLPTLTDLAEPSDVDVLIGKPLKIASDARREVAIRQEKYSEQIQVDRLIARLEEISDDLRSLRLSLDENLDRLRQHINDTNAADMPSVLHRNLIELEKTLAREAKNCMSFHTHSRKALEGVENYVSPPKYRVNVDGRLLAQRLETTKSRFFELFGSNEMGSSPEFTKRVLIETRRFLSGVDALIGTPELRDILREDADCADQQTFGSCVLGLLDSGVNAIVIGNAGVGKSTTLQMYALTNFSESIVSFGKQFMCFISIRCRRCGADICSEKVSKRYEEKADGEEVLFIPLSMLDVREDWESIGSIDVFCTEAERLISSVQKGVTKKFILARLRQASRLTLVFDGLDEAKHLLPWLVDFIDKMISQKGDSIQVVASSRFWFDSLQPIGFLQISLLPFRDEQLRRFIGSFLSDSPELARLVVDHLDDHPSMFDVCKTPLMATVLCLLAKSGVVLPETRNALYQERFDLLWGIYDAKKNVQRVRSTRSCLEDVSKKAAFFLHTRGLRSVCRERLFPAVVESLSLKYQPATVLRALNELIEPCNVLYVDWSGDVGFGHLSFQEYLVAEELYSNRQGEICRYLHDSWWRGVLTLIAMKCEDVGSLIDERIRSEGVIGDASETLAAMVEVCVPSQRSILKRLLSDHERLDELFDTESYDW